MSKYDLIINESFEAKAFQECFKPELLSNFVRILFQYPHQLLSLAAQEFANTLSLFTEVIDFSLFFNPYCIITSQSFEKIANGISSHLNNLKGFTLNIGDSCLNGNFTFFQHLNSISNLSEFNLIIGKSNRITNQEIKQIGSFLQNQTNLSTLKIFIDEENCITNDGFKFFSQAIIKLDKLIGFTFSCDLSRVDENGIISFAEALRALKLIKQFTFVNKEQQNSFPGVSSLLKSITQMNTLNSLHITFQPEKIIETEDINDFFIGLRNLKHLKSLVLKGFNLSLGHFSGNPLTDFLSEKQELEVLELSFDKISVENNFAQFLGQNLMKLSNLKELNLVVSNKSNLQGQGFKDIAKGIQIMVNLSSLTLIVQQGNRIGYKGLKSLGKAFKQLQILQHLNFTLEDKNDVTFDGLFELFEGVKCLTGLRALQLKLLTAKSKGCFNQLNLIGEALAELKDLQKLNLHIDTRSIFFFNMIALCRGLACLSELTELILFIYPISSEYFEHQLYKSIQHAEKLELLKIYCKLSQLYYDYSISSQPLIIGKFENLVEFHLKVIYSNTFSENELIRQGFQSMKSLRILKLELSPRHTVTLSTMRDIANCFILPESLEDLSLEIGITVFRQFPYPTFIRSMLSRLKKLKVLKINFNRFLYSNVIDLSESITCLKELTSLDIKLAFYVKKNELISLFSAIQQLNNLRKFTFIIPYFTGIESGDIQNLKGFLANLKNLYFYRELFMSFQQSNNNHYDQLLQLPSLTQYRQGQLMDEEEDSQQQIDHLVVSKFNHESMKTEAVNKSTNPLPINLTTLELMFYSNMSPNCYQSILKNLNQFTNLKELTLVISHTVYLTKSELWHLRVGLCQLKHLQTLALKCKFSTYYTNQQINKRIIYAIGKGLQETNQLDNLTLEIIKDSEKSFVKYFSELFKGIKAQNNLKKLSLKLNGLSKQDWEAFNLTECFTDKIYLQQLHISVEQMFSDSNFSQLAEGIKNLKSLSDLKLSIDNQNSINSEGALLLSDSLKNSKYLQKFNLVVLQENSGDLSSQCVEGILDIKDSHRTYIQDYTFNLNQINNDLSSQILVREANYLSQLKNLQSLDYQILFRKRTQQSAVAVENFYSKLFEQLSLPECLLVECQMKDVNTYYDLDSEINEKESRKQVIFTEVTIQTNDQKSYKLKLGFDYASFDECLSILAGFKQLTKLKLYFSKTILEQSKSFLRYSFNLANLQECFFLLTSFEKSNIDLFADGFKCLVNLKRATIMFSENSNNFEIESIEKLMVTLGGLKWLYFLIVSIYQQRELNNNKKCDIGQYFKVLGCLTNLKYFFFNQVASSLSTTQLSRFLKHKLKKLVHLSIEKLYNSLGLGTIYQQFISRE